MPIDAPDFVQWQQPIEVVATVPTPPAAAQETSLVKLGHQNTNMTAYVDVLSYTVPVGKVSVISEISLISDNFSKAVWRYQLKNSNVIADEWFPTTLTLWLAELRLEPGDIVLLSVKSGDGTQFNAWALITGKEVG